jgi:protein-disulfide isomerase
VNRSRLLLLAAAAAAAVVIVVVALVLVGGGPGPRSTTSEPSTTGAEQPASALAGIPQHGDTLGRAAAPATLLVFEDPQCPYCKEWNVGALPAVVERYVRSGRIKLVYRGITIIGPNSTDGLRAIYAAGRQNRLWDLVDALYARQGAENSGWITPAVIREAATEAGADPGAILAAAPTAPVTAALRQAEADARAISLRGTPTFVIQRPPGLPQQLNVPALDAASFSASLDAALR